jgi:hypothetical protein
MNKEEMFTELEDITRSDLFARFPEGRSIWSRMQGVAGWGSKLDSSLAFAWTLPLPVLRMLVEELHKGDKSASGPAELFMRLCPGPRSGVLSPSAAQIEADLIDQIIFRDIRVAHRTVIHGHALATVKQSLGLSREQSLATQMAPSYGLGHVFALVDIATSFGAVQLHHLLRLHPPDRGYSYLDDVDVSMDACVCMTATLASRILHETPTVDQIVAMMQNGGLGEWGITPSDLDEDEVHEHLLRLRETYFSRELPEGLAPGREDEEPPDDPVL